MGVGSGLHTYTPQVVSCQDPSQAERREDAPRTQALRQQTSCYSVSLKDIVSCQDPELRLESR